MKGSDAAPALRREGRDLSGSRSILGEWLDGRQPRAPDALLGRLDEDASADEGVTGDPDDTLAALLARADRALQGACAGEGERCGAFRLLAADAYLTWACEAALEQEDPSPTLREIVARVARHAGDG